MLESRIVSSAQLSRTTGAHSASRFIDSIRTWKSDSNAIPWFNPFQSTRNLGSVNDLHAFPNYQNRRRLYCGASSNLVYSLDHSKLKNMQNDHRLHKNSGPGWKTPMNSGFKLTFMTMLALTTVWSCGLSSCAGDAAISKDSGQLSPTVIKNSILRYGNYCGPGPAEVSPENDCKAVQGLPTVDAVDRQDSLAANRTVCRDCRDLPLLLNRELIVTHPCRTPH
jgi:hypothetical protein